MSDKALETLRLIFQDQPDLLKIIELGDIESSKLVGAFRENNELFATPINLYVTGRTGAGKTSLGNCLLEEVEMKSTGDMDCTDSIGYFKLASNLCYFDLPGSGSDEKYENINRAVLLMPQIQNEDKDIFIKEFKLIDYSNSENQKTETIK
jgi:predicted GTPase